MDCVEVGVGRARAWRQAAAQAVGLGRKRTAKRDSAEKMPRPQQTCPIFLSLLLVDERKKGARGASRGLSGRHRPRRKKEEKRKGETRDALLWCGFFGPRRPTQLSSRCSPPLALSPGAQQAKAENKRTVKQAKRARARAPDGRGPWDVGRARGRNRRRAQRERRKKRKQGHAHRPRHRPWPRARRACLPLRRAATATTRRSFAIVCVWKVCC